MNKTFLLLCIFIASASLASEKSLLKRGGYVDTGSCSGALVKFDGQSDFEPATVLTNAHCIDNKINPTKGAFRDLNFQRNSITTNQRLTIYGPNRRKYSTRNVAVLYMSGYGTDIAILQIDKNFKKILKLTGAKPFHIRKEAAKKSEKLRIVSGYFREEALSCKIKSSTYTIAVNNSGKKPGSYKNFLQETFIIEGECTNGNKLRSGWSGSPVIDENGKIIGIYSVSNKRSIWGFIPLPNIQFSCLTKNINCKLPLLGRYNNKWRPAFISPENNTNSLTVVFSDSFPAVFGLECTAHEVGIKVIIAPQQEEIYRTKNKYFDSRKIDENSALSYKFLLKDERLGFVDYENINWKFEYYKPSPDSSFYLHLDEKDRNSPILNRIVGKGDAALSLIKNIRDANGDFFSVYITRTYSLDYTDRSKLDEILEFPTKGAKEAIDPFIESCREMGAIE